MTRKDRDPSSVVWDGEEKAGAAAASLAATRRHGLIGAAAGLAVAALFYFFWRPEPAYVVAGVSLVLAALAFAAPAAHRRVTGWLDRFARAVAAGVTWVLMTLLYYLFFLPAGLLLRSRGKLAVTFRPDASRSSYWASTEDRPKTPESYRKQF